MVAWKLAKDQTFQNITVKNRCTISTRWCTVWPAKRKGLKHCVQFLFTCKNYITSYHEADLASEPLCTNANAYRPLWLGSKSSGAGHLDRPAKSYQSLEFIQWDSLAHVPSGHLRMEHLPVELWRLSGNFLGFWSVPQLRTRTELGLRLLGLLKPWTPHANGWSGTEWLESRSPKSSILGGNGWEMRGSNGCPALVRVGAWTRGAHLRSLVSSRKLRSVVQWSLESTRAGASTRASSLTTTRSRCQVWEEWWFLSRACMFTQACWVVMASRCEESKSDCTNPKRYNLKIWNFTSRKWMLSLKLTRKVH